MFILSDILTQNAKQIYIAINKTTETSLQIKMKYLLKNLYYLVELITDTKIRINIQSLILKKILIDKHQRTIFNWTDYIMGQIITIKIFIYLNTYDITD